MENKFLELENRYLEMTDSVLHSFRKKFDSLNITIEGPTLKEFDKNDYTSEISMTFYQNNDLVDELEFFVYNKGVEENSLEETRIWLAKTLERIIEENKN
jgi:hypothetical protein